MAYRIGVDTIDLVRVVMYKEYLADFRSAKAIAAAIIAAHSFKFSDLDLLYQEFVR